MKNILRNSFVTVIVVVLLLVSSIMGSGCTKASTGSTTKATASSQTTFTDGVVTATFDKGAGTLTFSGNGAVGNTSSWLRGLSREQRVFIRTIIFEDGITYIDDHEFSEDRNYINLERVVFEGDINSIGLSAFSCNKSLKEVSFKGKCRAIESLAFFKCIALDAVELPLGCKVNQAAFLGISPTDSRVDPDSSRRDPSNTNSSRTDETRKDPGPTAN